MKPRQNPNSYTVLAHCPDCDADTSFDDKGYASTTMGISIADGQHNYKGNVFLRVLWKALRCSVCSRGAVAKFHDQGNAQTAVLEDFLPHAVERAAVPAAVPEDILKEFREAELDAAHAAYRSASAMLRSVLEKTLTRNGYDTSGK